MADADTTSLHNEQWKPIPGFEQYYEVSDHGRVRSFDRVGTRGNGVTYRRKGRMMKQSPYSAGHLMVRLSVNANQRLWRVHRLVMLAFVGSCPEGMEVCHENGDPTDNRLGNLRYDTHSSNMLDRNEHGTCHYRKKTHCPRGHLLNMPNLVAGKWKIGHRTCLSCNRTSARVSTNPELRSNWQSIADSYYSEIMAHAAA